MAARATTRPHAFDPVLVGRAECDAWAAYYRRDWLRMLAGALGMVRHGFALGPSKPAGSTSTQRSPRHWRSSGGTSTEPPSRIRLWVRTH